MTKYLQLKQFGVKKSFRRYLIVPLLSLAFLFVVITHAVEVSNAQSSPSPQTSPSSTPTPSPSPTPTPSPSPPDGKKAGTKKDEPKETITSIKQGTITNIAIDLKQSKFSLEVQSGNSSPVILSVQEQKLQEILPKLSNGDLVDLDYGNKTKELKSLSVVGIIRKGTITNIAITPEQSSLEVKIHKNSTTPVTFSVKEPRLKAILLDLSKGDSVDLDYDYKTNELTSLSVATISEVSWLSRLGAILISGGLLYLLTLGIVNLTKKDDKISLNYIFVGQDKRLSNSKSQMAIWFFVVLVSYISFNVLRVLNGGFGLVGGISIPENLLVLSGISALTYGGAKVITQSQVNSKPGR